MKQNGGPAFPIWIKDMGYSNGGYVAGGMTLLDYFAAAALTGLCANSYRYGVNKPLSVAGMDEMAAMAYEQANALLAERDKK